MEINKAYLVGLHPATFRPNALAEIVGVVICKPNPNLKERLCYHIVYHDGYIDYVSVSDVENGNHIIVSFEDIHTGKLIEKIKKYNYGS